MAYSHPKQHPGVSVPPLVSKGTVCMWCMGIHTQNINIHKTHLKIKNKQKPILPLPIQILNHLMNTCAAWRSSSRGSASRCVCPQHYRVEGSRPIITSLLFLLSDAGICVPPKIDLRGLWKLSLLDWRTCEEGVPGKTVCPPLLIVLLVLAPQRPGCWELRYGMVCLCTAYSCCEHQTWL